MARKRFGVEFDGFLEMAERLDELAGKDGVKRAVEGALIATDKYVTAEVDKAVSKSKFNFERGNQTTKESIDRNLKIEWEGNMASAKAGFNISDGGLPSIFLMYGTPTIKPDTNLKNAAKGTGKHKKKIQEIQQEVFTKVINRVMNND